MQIMGCGAAGGLLRHQMDFTKIKIYLKGKGEFDRNSRFLVKWKFCKTPCI